ncbi:hypothetical protein [Amycolatopsis sp. NPDC051371]|uniref:hypothetical protein n=1 Tax=Amycolatopsis sp. NPDC051371 TaxID=3155800 RepID=UPI0034287C18
MDVREPALPVDPRLPGEPTVLEVGRTRMWLARRGVPVWLPTRLAITFVGGAALCAATFLTTPRFTSRHWYPPAVEVGLHTLALALGAGATALVLGRALRGPVIAEDAASRWVDELLRAEDPYRFAPSAVYAVLAMPVFVVDWATPGWLGWSALSYLVVVVVLQLTGWLVTRHRYRRLPPGYYGR